MGIPSPSLAGHPPNFPSFLCEPVLQGSTQKQPGHPSGCGAASPSQGRWDPDSLRPALSLAAKQALGKAALGALFA